MATLMTDPDIEKLVQAKRVAAVADRYDEVGEGTYVKAPMSNDEHQLTANRFPAIFQETIDWPELGDVRPGVNVSDREQNWQANYRVPDVAVFLRGEKSQNRDAFWYGDPDSVVEVVNPDDQTQQKLAFYASVGVREVLAIDIHGDWNRIAFRKMRWSKSGKQRNRPRLCAARCFHLPFDSPRDISVRRSRFITWTPINIGRSKP